MCYIQENIILYSIHAIFDREIFSKCTDSHAKEYNLYDKFIRQMSIETELSVSNSFRKDRPAPVSIPYISISSI